MEETYLKAAQIISGSGCEEVSTCSWMIIVGTSGMVYPAAGLPYIAKESNAFIIVVNTEKSRLSHLADICLLGSAGHILPRIMEGIMQEGGSLTQGFPYAHTGQDSSSKRQ